MTLLGGDAAELFGELFSDEYLPGTLTGVVSTYNDDGDLQIAEGERECRVQVEKATERMTRSEGYTESNRALYILAAPTGELPAIADLTSDHRVVVNAGPYAGTTFKIASPIDRDPAGAYWLVRGVESKAAANG